MKTLVTVQNHTPSPIFCSSRDRCERLVRRVMPITGQSSYSNTVRLLSTGLRALHTSSRVECHNPFPPTITPSIYLYRSIVIIAISAKHLPPSRLQYSPAADSHFQHRVLILYAVARRTHDISFDSLYPRPVQWSKRTFLATCRWHLLLDRSNLPE